MFGKLSWAAIPYDQPIPMAASVFIIVGVLLFLLGVIGVITVSVLRARSRARV